MLDEDGYPTEETLKQIEEWPHKNYSELMEYVRETWWHPDLCDGPYNDLNNTTKNTWRLSTGGWSGNEEIVGAMMNNNMFWLMCWEQSRRGGHYTFTIQETQ